MFFIFCVELCYILWSVLLHHWVCIAPLEINCTIGVVLRHCFLILFEFQVIRKGCTVCPKKKATIRFDSHSAQSYQNSFIFSDIEDIHQEFLLVKFEDH